MQIDVETVEFINIPPGSVLLIRALGSILPEEAGRMREVLLGRQIPNVVDVIVMSDTCTLSVMTASATQSNTGTKLPDRNPDIR